MSKSRNPVARNLQRYNKAVVHRDKKKDKKRGYNKHKNKASDLRGRGLFLYGVDGLALRGDNISTLRAGVKLMKYSHASLEYAIKKLLPHVVTMEMAGVPRPCLPKLLRTIAEDHFIGRTPAAKDVGLYLDVARSALLDLEHEGQFVFGDVDIAQ